MNASQKDCPNLSSREPKRNSDLRNNGTVAHFARVAYSILYFKISHESLILANDLMQE